MSKQDLNWKWYDSIFIILLLIMIIISAIIQDWMLIIVCIALLAMIMLMFYKDICVFIADLYLKRENINKANSYCDKVLIKDANNILALNKKAEILKTVGDYDKALSLCNKSIKINPDYSPTWILKSEIFECKSEKENAKKATAEAERIKFEFESKKLHNRILSKIYGFD